MNRDLIFKREISYNLVSKILTIILSYLSIPLYLKILGYQDYGVWMTIFSIINWIYILDLGIGNGLVNKLTESISLGKYEEGRKYITTGYIVLSIISFFIFIIGIILIKKLNISRFLNISFYSERYIKNIFTIVFSITIINFIMMIYTKFYLAKQRQSLNNIFSLVIQASILAILFIISYFGKVSLKTIAIIYPGMNLLISLIATIFFFKNNNKLKPSLDYFDKTKINTIGGIGLSFFTIQICSIIIFNTSNILLLKYQGAVAVTDYVLISKFFLLIKMIVALVLSPMWPLFTDAYIKKDLYWLKNIFKKLYKLYFLLILGVVTTVILLPYILQLWLGEKINVSNNVTVLWGICILISEFAGIHIIFINAIGKIKLQMLIYIFGGIIYFPLTSILIKNYGTEGLILGTILCVIPLAIFMPIQVYIILKDMKKSVD